MRTAIPLLPDEKVLEKMRESAEPVEITGDADNETKQIK